MVKTKYQVRAFCRIGNTESNWLVKEYADDSFGFNSANELYERLVRNGDNSQVKLVNLETGSIIKEYRKEMNLIY